MNINWVSSRTSHWIILGISLVVVLLSSTFASAVTSGGPGLTISPVRTELEILPGTAIDKVLTVANTTQSKMAVTLTAESFRAINPSYDYAFDKEAEITKWVRFSDDSFELGKGESKDITFSIGVPVTSEPGGRYLAMFASYDTASSSSDATISRQRVGSLLYITVSGDVTRNGSLVSLNSPSYIGGGQPQWSMFVQNSGSTHFRSRYSVSVENLIGGSSVATMTGNSLILPGTVKQIIDNIPLPKLPGIYKVNYTVGLGDTPAVVETRYIIYIPTVVLVVGLTAVILIISLLTQKVRKRKV